jgi:integrase
MPPLLVDEATGALPTVTLNTKDYYRVVGRTEESAARVSSSLQVSRPKTQGPETSWKATWKWKVALERCWSKEAAAFDNATQLWRDGQVGHNHIKRQCIANLEVVARACDDPVRIKLIEWCQSLLEVRRRPYRQGFAPYTVRQRLMALFGGVFGGVMPSSLADLSSDHVLQTAITKIGDEKSSLRRRLIDQAAKDFSNFLCGKEPGALDPDEEALAAEGGGEIPKLEKIGGLLSLPDLSRERSRVSANLLSFYEYRDVLEAAYKEDASGELALIIILAFRAGLRLREILGLQTSDILTYRNLSPEIHLRHNAFRNLKTYHSRRIIPLRSFLPQREADRLLAWLETRKVMTKGSNTAGLLFGDI